MANICPACMANMDMVGRSHRCIPRAPVIEISETRRHRDGTNRQEAQRCGLSVTGESPKTYLYRDQDKRRAYQRDLMRKRRAIPVPEILK